MAQNKTTSACSSNTIHYARYTGKATHWVSTVSYLSFLNKSYRLKSFAAARPTGSGSDCKQVRHFKLVFDDLGGWQTTRSLIILIWGSLNNA